MTPTSGITLVFCNPEAVVRLSALDESDPEEPNTNTEHHTADPLGQRPILLHPGLEAADLEDALLCCVVGRPQDQEDPGGNEHQTRYQGSFHHDIVAAPGRGRRIRPCRH